MFEAGVHFFIYLIDSITGGIYVQKLLGCRYQKKFVMVTWMGLYLIAQSLVLQRINGEFPVNDIVKVLADMSFILFFQILLYDRNVLKQLFVSVSFVAGKDIIRYIIIVLNYGLYWICNKLLIVYSEKITSMEKVKMWFAISNGLVWFVSLFMYILLMFVYFSIMSKKFIKRDHQLLGNEYAFLIFPSIVTLCISITLKILIFTVENGITTIMFEKVPETIFWVPFICILLLIVNISSVILFQKLVQLGEEERKRAILENQMIQMQHEIEEIQDIYADMRGLKHDMKSHLESIAALISKTSVNDKDEINGYIGKMQKTVSRLDFAYNTGSPITDVIIHQRRQEAEKRNIFFDVDFTCPDKQQIDIYDIGIVLNNALANAIEATGRLEGKKSIFLHSYMKGNLFFIEVENDFYGELIMDSKTGLPVSSKENQQHHGLGLENIQRCAKKYMGDIDITVHDLGERKRFSLTIMMHEKDFTKSSQKY